jgi:8-oxo-dGTP pyrophosphatase MutT (NUDIX family)
MGVKTGSTGPIAFEKVEFETISNESIALMSADQAKPPPIPSATLMLLRDGADGLEVFMVKRHHQIDFASGALVFPGGKLAKGDGDPALRAACDGESGLNDEELGLRACAIREGFEESGIILARPAGCPVLASNETSSRLQDWRPRLDSGDVGLTQFAAEAGVRLACDALVPFARWITPSFMPKRFDTHFYLAATPFGQLGSHDGREGVDSVWTTPQRAIAEKERWTVIFPTRMNLLKLAQSKTTQDAIERARTDPIITVEPKIVQKDGKPVLTLPPEAGYGIVEEPMDSLKA